MITFSNSQNSIIVMLYTFFLACVPRMLLSTSCLKQFDSVTFVQVLFRLTFPNFHQMKNTHPQNKTHRKRTTFMNVRDTRTSISTLKMYLFNSEFVRPFEYAFFSPQSLWRIFQICFTIIHVY